MTLDGLALTPGGIHDRVDLGRGRRRRGAWHPDLHGPERADARAGPSHRRPPRSQTRRRPRPPAPSPAPDRDARAVACRGPGAGRDIVGTDVLFPIIAALALVGVIGALLLRRNRAA